MLIVEKRLLSFFVQVKKMTKTEELAGFTGFNFWLWVLWAISTSDSGVRTKLENKRPTGRPRD